MRLFFMRAIHTAGVAFLPGLARFGFVKTLSTSKIGCPAPVLVANFTGRFTSSWGTYVTAFRKTSGKDCMPLQKPGLSDVINRA